MSERGVALPIVRVTSYEDRAEVVREATVELAGGPEALVLRELTPLLNEDRLVARIESRVPEGEAHVDDVHVEHRWIEDERTDTARLKELEDQVKAASDEVDAAVLEVARINGRRDSLERTASRYSEELGRSLSRGLETDAEAWQDGFTAFEEARRELDAALAKARARLEAANHEAERVTGLLQATRSRELRYVSEVRIAVSGSAGPARVILSAVVPCALWRPAHEAHLVDDATVSWGCYATLWQKTGEDWDDVELTLSTARPSAGARLPPLGADRLRLREKSREEKKKIRVEHRHEEVPRADLEGAAPGVYDGGEPRELRPPGRVSIPGDGRPHRVAVGSFVADSRVGKVAYPELSRHVFHRASLSNRAGAPLLAGPVTLLSRGSWVGIGDLHYVGEGEDFDVSFGSDDRFVLTHRRRRIEQERKLAKDRVHFVTEVDLSYSGAGEEEVTLLLRLPKSELKQLKVVASEEWCEPWPVESDDHGIVRVPVRIRPGRFESVKLGFRFETSGDVAVPDPW